MPDYVPILTWVFFVIAVSLLIPVVVSKLWLFGVVYALALSLILFILLQLERQRRILNDINLQIKTLSPNPLKDELNAVRLNETKRLVGEFSTEMKLEEYKKEQEKKFRELSKKVLGLDNKLNEKFDLLGEAVVKLSKEKKD